MCNLRIFCMTLQKNWGTTLKIFLIIPLILGDLAVAKNYEKRPVSVQVEDSNIVLMINMNLYSK